MRATFAALICIIAFGSLAADLPFLDYFGLSIVLGLPMLPFAIVGALLVVRGAGGPVGWLLGAVGALFQLWFLLSAYASLEGGAASPGGALAVWVLSSFMATTMFGLVVATLVLFPDGRPPNRASAILLWILGAIEALDHDVAKDRRGQPRSVRQSRLRSRKAHAVMRFHKVGTRYRHASAASGTCHRLGRA